MNLNIDKNQAKYIILFIALLFIAYGIALSFSQKFNIIQPDLTIPFGITDIVSIGGK